MTEGSRNNDAERVGLNFDLNLLILSIVPSSIGFVLFTYGRKLHRFPQLLCGILFMVYPYFTPNVASMVGVGVSVGAALYVMLTLGW
jgi:hypothetical protein